MSEMSIFEKLFGVQLSNKQAYSLVMMLIILLGGLTLPDRVVEQWFNVGERITRETIREEIDEYIDLDLGGSPYQTEKTAQYIMNHVGVNTYALLGDDGKLHGFYDVSEDSMKTWVRGNMTGEHAYLRNITNCEGYIIEANNLKVNSTVGEYLFGQAGEDLFYGDTVYIDADGKYYKTDANLTAKMYCVAMAAEALSTDGWGIFMQRGYAQCDGWSWTVGSEAPIMVSWVPGLMTQTLLDASGDQVQRVGHAISEHIIYFEPDTTVVELQ